jgi:iron(II)-dependent oxidoreductase
VNEAGADRLTALQAGLRKTVASVDDADYRTQFDPLLSPLGWHLRHCVFLEALWLRERVLGDDSLTAPLIDLCLPERAPKHLRGPALPERDALLAWADETMAENNRLLTVAERNNDLHRLVGGGYLREFLVAHHAQHLETMHMALTARAATRRDGYQAAQPLTADPAEWAPAVIDAGRHAIGADHGFAYDNESPRQHVALARFALADTPVTNAQYFGFMEAGGYAERRWWTDAGWQWRAKTGAEAPHGWYRDPADHWFSVGSDGARDLQPDTAVTGLSRYEASAFAVWAEAALPHEYEWEAAHRLGRLKHTGKAWEWCANPFHPYPGFRDFPYREYSLPWYDTRHYVLRGGGPHTAPETRRPSFRNYYLSDARHIFAGVRLKLKV